MIIVESSLQRNVWDSYGGCPICFALIGGMRLLGIKDMFLESKKARRA